MTKFYFAFKTLLIGVFVFMSFENINAQCDVQIDGLSSEYCITDNPVALEGYPLGGTFSGDGISGTQFNPATAGAGIHEITYDFDSIFYNVYTNGTFNPIDGIGTSVTLSDDQVSAFLPLGFTFNFFGTDYTQVRLSSNGFITFNNSTSSGCCEGRYIPSNDGINNIIAFAWADLNPNEGGSFQYYTIGTAPNRIFIIDVKNLSHYGFPGRVTSQIQLHETTNNIEIHTTEMGYGGANHTMGIENVDGSLGYAVEGRNASIWTAQEEMVQFVPEYCTNSVSVNVTVNDNPAEVGVSVTELDYGNVESNATITKEFTLTNLGCSPLVIDSLRNAESVYTYTFADNQTLNPGSSVTVEVVLNSTTLGAINDTIGIYTDADDVKIDLLATIVASPAMSVDKDTIELTINACSGTENGTFNVLNSAAGQLNYTVGSYADFSDDFEDGNYNDWEGADNFVSVEVQSDEVAETNKALKIIGQDDVGLIRTFDARQVTYISYWIKPDYNTWGGVGVSFGDDNNGNTNSGLIDQTLWFDSYFYFGDNSNGNEYRVIDRKWYHIEYKNIDFENSEYDWYVDGELVAEDLSFGSGGNYISTIRLYAEYYNNLFYVDDIFMGDETDWLTLTPQSGTLANTESDAIQVTMSADGLNSGVYKKYLFINGNDPDNATDTVLCILNVDGTPQAELSVTEIDFGEVFIGDSIEQDISLTNVGCDTLFISSISQQGDYEKFIFTNHSGLTILPGEKLEGTIKFIASAVGTYNSGISFMSNTTTQYIALSGSFVTSPEIVLSTDTVKYDLTCSEEITQSFTISNSEASDLNFQIEINDVDLEDVLTNLNSNYQSIINLIPDRYDFDYGDYDTYIESGGDYMYNDGNYLSTNIGGDLVYSDNEIIPSTLLGDEGEYFVRKFDGLFVFAGKLDDVSNFYIDGGLNNWDAQVDDAILEYEYNGIKYYGFVKRVYGSNSPSVNHLIITRNPEVEHTFSTSNSDDNHEINNLEKSSELFYLLYAGSFGGYINDDETMAIMQQFIQSISPFIPDYVTPDVLSSTVNAGSQEVNVTVSGTNFNTGTHYRELMIASNDPLKRFQLLTLEINVTGTPEIDTDVSSINYGNVAIADSLTKELTIYNTGCDTLFITNITSSAAQFTVDVTELEILPDKSYSVKLKFKPEAVQAYSANLTIESDAGNPVIALSGSGVNSGPQIAIDSTSYTMILECENEKSGIFTITNTGEADLVVNITDDVDDLILDISDATILAGESLEVGVTFEGEQSLAGTYTGNITITSNDRVSPTELLPVSITDSYNKVVFVDIDWEEDHICQGEEIIVDAGSGFSSYSWAPEGNTQKITVNTTGKYIVTVDDFNGCESKDSVSVTVHNPIVNLGDDVGICQGESITLDAGAGYSYNWSTSESTQTISVSTANTYAVTITDAYECSADDEIVVTVNDLPVVDLGDDVTITDKETTTLDAGSGFDSYLWNDPSSTATQTLVVSGSVVGVGTHNYAVVVTDANGCEGTDNVNVIVTASTGINNFGKEMLSVYPNPVKENLFIQFGSDFAQNATIKLYDLTGSVKYLERIDKIKPDGLYKIELSKLNLNSGIYLLQINNEESSYVEQIMIK